MIALLLAGAAVAAEAITVKVQAGNVPSVEPITVHLRGADGTVLDVVVTDDGRGDDARAEDGVWTGSGSVAGDQIHVSLSAGSRLFPEGDARWTEVGDRTLRLVVKGRELEVHADVGALRVGRTQWELGFAVVLGLLVTGVGLRQGRVGRAGVLRVPPPPLLDGSRVPRGRVRVDDPAAAAVALAAALAPTHTVFLVGDIAAPAAPPGRLVRPAPADPDRLPALVALRRGEALAVVVRVPDDEVDDWADAAEALPADVPCLVLVGPGDAGPELLVEGGLRWT